MTPTAIAIAATLANAKKECTAKDIDLWGVLVFNVSQDLKRQDPSFDSKAFWDACHAEPVE